jgi:hypothetical protein
MTWQRGGASQCAKGPFTDPMGDPKIRSPVDPKRLNQSTQNFAGMITSLRIGICQIWSGKRPCNTRKRSHKGMIAW